LKEDSVRIVLLPGLHGTDTLFQDFIGRCPRPFDPISISFPTHKRLSYADLDDYVWERIPNDGPLVILGESFSGPLSLRLSTRRPAGLIGVVLVASFIRLIPPFWIWWLPWTLLFSFRPLLKIVRAAVGAKTSEDSMLTQMVRAERKKVSSLVLAHRMREIGRMDAEPYLRNCPAPLLYLQSLRDHLVPRHSYDEIRSVRPDVGFEAFDTGHLVLQNEPVKTWKVISEFVRNKCLGREA
jgi:pimeloyl-ACP methyl ester carboxylesterase